MTNKSIKSSHLGEVPERAERGRGMGRYIDQIIVHCAATPEGKNFTVADIDRWHRQRGWRCIGYHYVVYLDGSVHRGRPEEQVGAHCLNHNAHSIGVCYIGGTSPCPSKGGVIKYVPKDTRTPEQKASLIMLIKDLKTRYPNATIHSHSEFTCQRAKSEAGFRTSECSRKCTGCKYANKACPVFDAQKEYSHF